MSSPPTHDDADPLQERLVAYLDGELDEPRRAEVEEQLARDATCRSRLQGLQQAWDCLDALPESTVDEDFARSTVEMVALQAEEDLGEAEASLPTVHRQRKLATVATLLVSALVGFLLATALRPDANRELIRDLPVLENLDAYLEVQDIEFVRLLARRDVLGPEVPAPDGVGRDGAGRDGPRQAGEPASDASAGSPTGDPAERRAWIEALQGEAKAGLAARQQRFAALGPEQRDALRHLDRQLRDDPDAESLQQAVARYHDWLAQLSPGKRSDLAALEPAARLEEIHRLEQKRRQRQALQPSPADMEAIFAWLGEYVTAHRTDIMATIPESRRRQFGMMLKNMDEDKQRAALVAMAWGRMRQGGVQLPEPSPQEREDLIARLSPQARARLQATDGREGAQRLIVAWAQAAIRARFASRFKGSESKSVSEEQLEQFFANELEGDERERLMALPPAEMRSELRQIYAERKQTWRPEFGGGAGHGGRGGPGGGRHHERGPGERFPPERGKFRPDDRAPGDGKFRGGGPDRLRRPSGERPDPLRDRVDPRGDRKGPPPFPPGDRPPPVD